MEIRAATVEDAPVLAELHVRCWQEAYEGQLPAAYLESLSVDGRLGMWQRLLSSEVPSTTFLAEDEAGPLGFVAVGRSDDADASPRVGCVFSIYVRARGWGTGAGRLLMSRGLTELRAQGFDEATLWVLDTNSRARRFYDAGAWSTDSSKTDEIGGATVTEIRYRLSL